MNHKLWLVITSNYCFKIKNLTDNTKQLINQDEKIGILFKAGDATSLADSMLSLLNSPEKWDALRQQGRVFVETERNWPVSVSYYKNVYNQIFKKGSLS